ncbi:MAG: hypothetical protein AAB501_03415 [Patescibacteria group bacterium]
MTGKEQDGLTDEQRAKLERLAQITREDLEGFNWEENEPFLEELESIRQTLSPEVASKLDALTKEFEEFCQIAEILMDYIDKVNAGNRVGAQEVLRNVELMPPSAMKERLQEDLRFSTSLLQLGKWYREKKA